MILCIHDSRQELRQQENEVELLQILWQQIRALISCLGRPTKRKNKAEPKAPIIDWSSINKMKKRTKKQDKPHVSFFLEDAFMQLADSVSDNHYAKKPVSTR